MSVSLDSFTITDDHQINTSKCGPNMVLEADHDRLEEDPVCGRKSQGEP